MNSSSTVFIGTEDYDARSHRLPNLLLNEELYPIVCLTNGFQITIPLINAGQTVSLHYVIASNPFPEPVDCSCWYAVDIPHRKVLEARVKR